jgi:hypothetical protein
MLAMTRLVRLLFLVAWLAGAVASGYTVEPATTGPSERVYVVSRTDWAGLTVRTDQIVLWMGRGPSQWCVATPTPAFVADWFRDAGGAVPDPGRKPPLENAPLIPL